MRSLDAITAACYHAIVDKADGLDQQYVYAESVDPQSVLELVTQANGLESMPSGEEMQSLGKVIRDLTEYTGYTAKVKADPVRDDLVQQANQVVGLTGL